MKKEKITKEVFTRQLNQIKAQEFFAIVDLEATCTDDPRLRDSFINEIIEIGLVVWDRKNSVFNEYQIYVKPLKSTITSFCTQLTGIDANTLKDAVPFSQAMKQVQDILQQYPGLKVWGSYGGYDKNQFSRQALREQEKNPFASLEHVNIKDLAWFASGSSKSFGLGSALALNKLVFEGRPHSGIDDAYNIAVLTNHLLATN